MKAVSRKAVVLLEPDDPEGECGAFNVLEEPGENESEAGKRVADLINKWLEEGSEKCSPKT